MAPSNARSVTAPTTTVPLHEVPATGDGVAWSVSPEGFHANLVTLGAGREVGEHTNAELDVLVVVLAGEATVVIDGTAHSLTDGHALLVPRGTRRRIAAGAERGVRYLTVHASRRPMGIARAEPRRAAPS